MSKFSWKRNRTKERQLEALERKAHYDGLTLTEKISRAVSSPGNSRRQFKRFAVAAEQQGEV